MPLHQGFRLGRFEVLPAVGALRGPAGERAVHPHAMEVLLLLAQNAGKLVTRRQIMLAVWGNHPVSQDTLTRNVAELRQALEDDPQHPRFIQTVPRRGYRLVASVTPLHDDPGPPPEPSDRKQHPAQKWLSELLRRSVFKNLAIYAVLSWTCVEVADVVLPYLLEEPSRVMAGLLALVATGYPATALLSWVLEITEHGVVVDARATRWRRLEARQALVLLGVLIALAIGLVTYWAASPPFMEGRVRLAVLPLDNLGPAERKPFCDGLTEELTYTLSRIPVIKVAARKSAEAVAGGILPISEIGSRLNVSHVLEGSCQYDEDKLKVTAQLIDADTGFHSWSQAYVVAPTSIFDIQQDIARQVARALRVLLSTDIDRRLQDPPSENSKAYGLYLEARGFLRKARQAENLARAQSLFESAIVLDPAFAGAHAGLCETFLAWYELERASSRFEQANGACRKAMERSRGSAEVQLALAELARYAGNYQDALSGFLRASGVDPSIPEGYIGQARSLAAMRRPEEAEAAFRVAIAEDPVYWVSINAYGAFLFQQGRYEEAVAQFARVARLDPGNASAFNNLGGARFMAGDFAAAGQAYERSIAIAPKAAAMSNSGTMYFYAGDFARAEQLYRRALAVAPEDYRVWGSLGDALQAQAGTLPAGVKSGADWADAYRRAAELARAQLAVNDQDHMARASLAHYLSRLGDVEEAEDQLRRAVAAAPADMDVRYNQALVMARLGRKQEALQALREALRAGYQPALLRADPGLAALRGLPEFQEMVNMP